MLLPGEKKPETFMVGTISADNSTPVTANTLFKVGSIAKTYTATLVARAIKENKLSLNDQLGAYLPQYTKWKKITILQLVNQTSGIIGYDETPNWWPNLISVPNKIWTSSELVQLAYNSPLQFSPGQSWAYSNTNYILLGMILEKVFNQPISNLMNTLISQASLSHTFYYPQAYDAKILAQLAHGYFMNQFDETSLNESWLQTAGAILSTPSDMCLWMQTLFTDNKISGLPISQNFNLVDTSDGKKSADNSIMSYSFGVFKEKTPVGIIYFTPGLTSGYVSMMVYAPSLHVYFAYSSSKAPTPGFHNFMISSILNALSNNKAVNWRLAIHF